MMRTTRRMLPVAALLVYWICLGWGTAGRAAEPEPNFSASLTVHGGTIEYTPEVGKEQATKLGEYLKTGFFDGTPKSTRIAKIKDTYEFWMVAADGAIEDVGTMAVFPYFPPELSHNVFEGTHLIVRLCDNRWKPLKSFDSTAVGKAAKFANGILVYPPEVDAARVQLLGKLMLKRQFFGSAAKLVRLDPLKDKDGYHLRISLAEDKAPKQELLDAFEDFAAEMSITAFDCKSVRIDFCFGSWEPTATVEWGGHGIGTIHKGGALFRTPAVDAKTAKALGDYLVKSGFFDGSGKLVQIDKAERTFRFRFLVKSGIEQDEKYVELLGKFRKELSTKVFRSAPVEIDMCNLRFETLRTIADEGK